MMGPPPEARRRSRGRTPPAPADHQAGHPASMGCDSRILNNSLYSLQGGSNTLLLRHLIAAHVRRQGAVMEPAIRNRRRRALLVDDDTSSLRDYVRELTAAG